MEKKRMENKMQDSQKTKDELWNRLWKEFGQLVYMESMKEHVKRGANGDLVDFIASEISKAREEGRKYALKEVEYTLAKDTRYEFLFEELEVIRELCNFEYEKCVALDLEDSKEELGNIVDKIVKKLDKLNKKK